MLGLKLRADQEPQARELLGAEAGLLLLGVRATGPMGVVLTVHLGLVLALFVTLPYGKFVHGVYRLGALLRHAGERPGVKGDVCAFREPNG